MHPTSAENMERCIRWYLKDSGRQLRIADLGSHSVNGSYRPLFHSDVDYVGFDLAPGPGVDVVLESPYQIPAEPASFDLVISGQMLEHCPHFWLLASEIHRVLRPGGLAFLIAPSAGPIHRYPVDCYRFFPDAWQALADWAELRLIHLWHDERGPWRDLVGVFGKDTEIEPITEPQTPPRIDRSIQPGPACARLIREIHARRRPELCVEIGTAGSGLLPTAMSRRILIESSSEPSRHTGRNLTFACSADDFFFFLADQVITTAIDLAVIDGHRSAANILRDFMQLERRMNPTGAIVITNARPAQAGANVARIASLLSTERPELALNTTSADSCELLTITGLQPRSDILWQRYNPLVRKGLRDDRDAIGCTSAPESPPGEGSSFTNGSSQRDQNVNRSGNPPEPQQPLSKPAIRLPTEKIPANLAEYQAMLAPHGHTDTAYLQQHFRRFIGTFHQFSRYWGKGTDAHVLDIGAHWLHQSILYAQAGFRVTAADFPSTLERRGVQALARAYDIDLLIYSEIESGSAFDQIPDDSIDVLLFSEILEHITFNPIAFWESIYRILKPGSRIIVTTPNFYSVRGHAWQVKRFLSGFGAGIDNLEIVRTPTHGHHWKEYSRKEVCHYFCSLSPDFHVHRALEVNDQYEEPKSLPERMTRFLLSQLYLEVDLPRKDHGITMKSSW